MEKLMCPATNRPCKRPEICGPINESVIGAIPEIRRELEGASLREVGTTLVKTITRVADQRISRRLHPVVEGFETRICPGELLDSEVGQRIGAEATGLNVIDILESSVEAATRDIQRQRASYRH